MLALTITIAWGWWIVPAIITVMCLISMFTPSRDVGFDSWGIGGAIDGLMRLLLIIPIMFVWLVYLIIYSIWGIA